ncbi:hypothetical protein LUZ61_002142 [Rhynchospora tenuis]|uniref:RNase H type-1 domain-containing protein n=1 Tax=Rhynchospora tenuis TaxID=198213 RepID=A0AAD5ZIB6_9POAL|nr:hypothetical protein LUZ61_002142 [Rhynchospora tenuis]
MSKSDLFDFDTNQWRLEELASLFTQTQIMQILNVEPKPNMEAGIQDKLIWTISKRGKYTAKEGYAHLWGQQGVIQPTQSSILWQKIQNWKGIIPKVQIFLWRLIFGALMLSQNVHRRILKVSPMCQRCGEENEFETHCFFFCQGSRVVWFASPLSLRTQDLSLNVINAIEQCTGNMNEDQIKIFCYTLWEIWKGRNETVLHNQKFEPIQIQKKVQNWLSTETAWESLSTNISNEGVHNGDCYWFHHAHFQLLVDGSWDQQNKAGTGYLLFQGGRLNEIGYSHHSLNDAFLVEVVAVKRALERWMAGNWQNQFLEIFSDCLELVKILNEEDVDNLPSWRALYDVIVVIKLLNQLKPRVKIMHVRREVVDQAHKLANHARRTGSQYAGIHRPWHAVENYIRDKLDEKFFQRVQEAPP